MTTNYFETLKQMPTELTYSIETTIEGRNYDYCGVDLFVKLVDLKGLTAT